MTCAPALAAAVMLLMGCASAPRGDEDGGGHRDSAPYGAVGASLIAPPADARRMAAAPNLRFIHPNLDADAGLPVYPSALLPERLDPVRVCIDVAIDAAGVVAAAAMRSDEGCPRPDRAAIGPFAEAALAAVRQWTYAPALLCEAPADYAGSDPCTAADAVETPTAVRLSYAFRFSQQDGAPVVERVGGP